MFHIIAEVHETSLGSVKSVIRVEVRDASLHGSVNLDVWDCKASVLSTWTTHLALLSVSLLGCKNAPRAGADSVLIVSDISFNEFSACCCKE